MRVSTKDGRKRFLENIDDSEDGIFFFGNNLRNNSDTTFAYGSPQRLSIINSLIDSIRERLSADDTFEAILQPLNDIKSTTSSESLLLCHSFIASDLDQEEFCEQYYQSADLLKDFQRKSAHESLQKLTELSTELTVFKTALARAIAAKPHSSDVERLISNIFRCTAMLHFAR